MRAPFRDEYRVISTHEILFTLDQTGGFAIDDRNRLIELMNMTRQGSAGFETPVSSTDPNRAEMAGEQISEVGARGKLVPFGLCEASDMLRLATLGIFETTLLD